MMTGIELIAAERQRQIEQEGWTSESDARHVNGELAEAAACYAMTEGRRTIPVGGADKITGETAGVRKLMWPWHESWWKSDPDNRVKDLVKAGALIAAEIDRLSGSEQP